MQGDKLVAVANGGGCRIVVSTAEAPLRGRVGVIAVEKKRGRTKGKGYRSFQACMQCSGGSGTRQSCGWPAHPDAGRKRASGKSQSQTMRLRSLGLGEFEITHDVGDNVLYHSLSGLASGQQLRVVCPIQRLSAHWFAPAKCAHWHF
jgi:hypothetical protein